MVVSDALGSIMPKQTTVAYFETPSKHWPRRIEENNGKLQSGEPNTGL
jgi:hypothetical protein